MKDRSWLRVAATGDDDAKRRTSMREGQAPVVRLLFLGETPASARYLLGVFAHASFNVRHVDSRQTIDHVEETFDAILFSDFPAKNVGPSAFDEVAQAIRGGAGLVMIGGWTSFTGMGNGYRETPIAPLLPVVCAEHDDRRNVPTGMWLEALQSGHPLLQGLDLGAPPVLCGHNEVAPAAGATLLACGRKVVFSGGAVPATDARGVPAGAPAGKISISGATPGDASTLSPAAGEAVPLLVVDERDSERRGRTYRTIAYTSDLVPHWCGGIVDWGSRRLALSTGNEVSDGYVRFVTNLVRWAAKDL